MALAVYPITGTCNAADFANALDKLFGEVDHGSTDLAFQLTLLSQAGGINTWQLTAGAYILDGYIFISDGTETITVAEGSSQNIVLYYKIVDGYITEAGVDEASKKPAGAVEKILWVVNGPTAGSTAPFSKTDNRRINTWGRASYANTDGDAVTLSATRAVTSGSLVTLKSFRVAYPGSAQLTFDYKYPGGGFAFVFVKRNGTAIQTTNLSNAADWTARSYAINNLMPGDLVTVDGQLLEVRNAYLRYKLTDLAASAVITD